jgi:hypothetical protein
MRNGKPVALRWKRIRKGAPSSRVDSPHLMRFQLRKAQGAGVPSGVCEYR